MQKFLTSSAKFLRHRRLTGYGWFANFFFDFILLKYIARGVLIAHKINHREALEIKGLKAGKADGLPSGSYPEK